MDALGQTPCKRARTGETEDTEETESLLRSCAGIPFVTRHDKAAWDQLKRCMRVLHRRQERGQAHACSMPVALDELWHKAILETRMYKRLCEQMLGAGEFLHHSASTRTSFDDPVRLERVCAAARDYEEMFGQRPPASVWTELSPAVRVTLRDPDSGRALADASVPRSELVSFTYGDLARLVGRPHAEHGDLLFGADTHTRIPARAAAGSALDLRAVAGAPLVTRVRTLDREETAVLMHASDSVRKYIRRVGQSAGIPAEQLRLVYAGQQVVPAADDDDDSVKGYGIGEGSVVTLVRKLLGC